MKTLRFTFVILFLGVIFLPLFFFNFTPNSISHIDNRKLTENPFSLEGSLSSNIESYVNDRIGFRDFFIKSYTVLNDRLFDKMVHPSYSYGQDGYVFGAGITTENDFGDFHIAFADMVKSIQDYCESRGIPFLFVFNPAKPAVYPDKIADGIYYDRQWVSLFLNELDRRQIQYLDNTVTLKNLRVSGEDGFNQKYDANHWNDWGAFHGTLEILKHLQKRLPEIHINDLSEFSVSKAHKTSLLVSNFPIDEYVPVIESNAQYHGLQDLYSAIDLHPSYTGFSYYVNENRKSENAPKALIFQGSYMNGYGYKYMINALGECIFVHDYQNVINFPYYFNIFQPDCVIFEVAEYTFSDVYFSFEKMKSLQYNPPLSSLSKEEFTSFILPIEKFYVKEENALTKITWKTDSSHKHVWLELDNIYDMQATEEGYTLTLESKQLNKSIRELKLIVSDKQ